LRRRSPSPYGEDRFVVLLLKILGMVVFAGAVVVLAVVISGN
jgi:hypothetical protein